MDFLTVTHGLKHRMEVQEPESKAECPQIAEIGSSVLLLTEETGANYLYLCLGKVHRRVHFLFELERFLNQTESGVFTSCSRHGVVCHRHAHRGHQTHSGNICRPGKNVSVIEPLYTKFSPDLRTLTSDISVVKERFI